MRARRRAKEKSVDAVPPPEVGAADTQDWRPVLDHELSRLPEKYQAPLVLCDLEARPRKEVARQLGIPEGTLSSRLANGRKLLAARLARRGVTLAGGALAAALVEGVSSAHVPGPLVSDTAKAATLVAAGQLAGISTPVTVLMKGVLKAMYMAKFKLVVGLLVGAALTVGAGSLVYQPAGAQNASATKPLSELDALRKENELLKLNLQVVLEKVRAQEAELRDLKGKQANKQVGVSAHTFADVIDLATRYQSEKLALPEGKAPVIPLVEDALQKVRLAGDETARRQALDALEQAVKRLRAELGVKDHNELKKP
jgi:predicted DNA-binding protein (UPF0251 family)